VYVEKQAFGDCQWFRPASDETLREQEMYADQAMQLGRVRDRRLGYQHARWTHTIAAFNFLHHVLGNNFQQSLFAFA
jgi:hypothetical protein